MLRASQPEPWYRRAVLYHVYPLSFADGGSDGYGDLRGLINHLDYLNDGTAESLGVGALWLSPIFASPMADFGYDVSDYRAINPVFGSMVDFDELLERAHARGIRIMLDFVPNHTSVQHAWFTSSSSGTQDPKRDWYIWADGKPGGAPPNNWKSRFGGPAWTFDEATGQWYLHTFLPDQPDLNWRNPAVREAMMEVLRFWLRRGVDGFRTDAVEALLKDAQLRDNPPNPAYVPGVSDPADEFMQVYSAMSGELGDILNSFCEVLAESDDERYLVTEAYLGIAGMSALYHACAIHPVHAPFNFNLMSLPWSGSGYRDFIDTYEASLRPQDWPNYVVGNHDHMRLGTRLTPLQARLTALLQMTLRGLPVVYYGDELGLPDAVVPEDRARDPWGKRVPGFGFGRDPERSPLPWTNEHYHGFSDQRPWLPFVNEAASFSIETQERDPESMLHLYRHLIHLRNTMPALIEGDYRSLDLGNDDVFSFMRETGSHRICVVLNFSHVSQSVAAGDLGRCIAGTVDPLGDGTSHTDGSLLLAGYEGRVYEIASGVKL